MNVGVDWQRHSPHMHIALRQGVALSVRRVGAYQLQQNALGHQMAGEMTQGMSYAIDLWRPGFTDQGYAHRYHSLHAGEAAAAPDSSSTVFAPVFDPAGYP
jgi:hypothetical protein